MDKPDLEHRHLCPQCNTKFYDLNRNPALCPKCGHQTEQQRPNPPTPTERPSPAKDSPNNVRDNELEDMIPDDEGDTCLEEKQDSDDED